MDFVSQWEGVEVRKAGQILNKNFVEGRGTHLVAKMVKKVAEKEAPPAMTVDPPPVEAGSHTNYVGVGAGERADSLPIPSVQTPAADKSETPSRNEPLTFGLKNIESDHPSVNTLGIHEDVIAAFGVGYYSGKGMMKNRIVIPVYNTSKQLVAYAGFHPEERTYTYPPKFRRELELYNLSGALADLGADQGVILVRNPLEVLTLVSAGYLNAVAIMGDTLSSVQKGLLLCEYTAGERVALLWPTQVDVVPTLSELLPDFFVRLRRYEEESGIPSGITVEKVQELLV